MRFIFKTTYDQDIRLVKHGGQAFWYGLLGLALAAAPLLPEYYLSQLTFVCIYALVGVGLMLLTGYTGQISLGHAAFLAVGAYTEAVLQAKGVPFGVSLVAAGALAGLAGIVIGLPALRLTGIYLAIATIAFGFIVQEAVTRWESVTRGNSGITLKPIAVAGFALDQEWQLYYLALALLVLVIVGILNLLRCADRDAPSSPSATPRSRRRAWESIWRAPRPPRSRFRRRSPGSPARSTRTNWSSSAPSSSISCCRSSSP